MKAKRLKRKSIVSKAITMCIIVIVLAAISIYLIQTYRKIDINESNYQTERTLSTTNEQTVESVAQNSKTVSDTLEETIKCVVGISKLKNNGMVNDNNFYIAYISDRIRLSNDGPNKIKNELLNHNIDLNKINEELFKYNDLIYEKLDKLINKKIKTNKDSEYIMKQKLTNHFINLGYDKEMISEILSNIKVDNSKSLKLEYEKQYNKLSKKYSGDELKYKIKNALYQKGYKIDEINKIM